MQYSSMTSRNKQAGYLSIDDVEVVEGSSKGSYTMLNTNKELYIGRHLLFLVQVLVICL